jgi:hypothetical protein
VGNIPVRLANIANYVALHTEDFNLLHFNAMNRMMAVALAKLLHVDTTPEEIDAEAQRFRNRCGLIDPECFTEWLERNHISDTEFRILMTETALCRRLHRWFLYARWTQRSVRLVLDQLRWENRYQEWAQKTAAQERLLQVSGDSLMTLEAWSHSTPKLLEEHQQWVDLIIDTDPETWAEDVGFHGKPDLKLELLRAKVARETLLRMLDQTLRDDDSDESDLRDTALKDGTAGEWGHEDDGNLHKKTGA